MRKLNLICLPFTANNFSFVVGNYSNDFQLRTDKNFHQFTSRKFGSDSCRWVTETMKDCVATKFELVSCRANAAFTSASVQPYWYFAVIEPLKASCDYANQT